MNKSVIVLSKNDILYRSLKDNICNTNIDYIKERSEAIKYLSENHKATIIVIDEWDDDFTTDLLAKYSKYIFCFKPNKYVHSLVFTKPFRLEGVILEIEKSLANNRMFCIINGNVYDELRSIIIFPSKILHLTRKENSVIREILLTENYFVSRSFLLQNIWRYSTYSQTTTIESCINRLRSKLPSGMLEQLKDGYQLHIKHFF